MQVARFLFGCEIDLRNVLFELLFCKVLAPVGRSQFPRRPNAAAAAQRVLEVLEAVQLLRAKFQTCFDKQNYYGKRLKMMSFCSVCLICLPAVIVTILDASSCARFIWSHHSQELFCRCCYSRLSERLLLHCFC